MHSFSVEGLIYRIFAVGIFMFLMGMFLLWVSKKKKRKSDLIFAICAIIFSIFYIAFFAYKSYNPNVVYHEGYLVREYRDSRVAPPFPCTNAYSFTNGDEKHRTFYLDVFSKKKIFQEDFSKETKYRIYYEEDTHIILRIDEIGT